MTKEVEVLDVLELLKTNEQIRSAVFVKSADYKVLVKILADILTFKSTGVCDDATVNSVVERLIPFNNRVYTIINSMDYIAAEESVVAQFRGNNDLRVTSTIKLLLDNLLYFLSNDFKYLSSTTESFRVKLGVFLNTPLSSYGVNETAPRSSKPKITLTKK